MEVKEYDGATPAGDTMKLDEFNIGEFRPKPDAEAAKSENKLKDIEETIKVLRELKDMFENQNREIFLIECEVDSVLKEEAKYDNLK